MENDDTILNNSQEPEECKINDSNKNMDKDLCLFLPKNIVEEIADKKTDTNEIEEQSHFSFSSINSESTKNHGNHINSKNLEKLNHNHQNQNHNHNRISKNNFFKNGINSNKNIILNN